MFLSVKFSLSRAFLAWFGLGFALCHHASAFYSLNAVEAKISFTDEVMIWSHGRPTEADIMTEVSEIVKYMPGPLHVRYPDQAHQPPKAGFLKKPRVKVLGTPRPHPSMPGVWLGRYQMEDLFVIENKNLDRFEIVIPNRVDTIYEEAKLPHNGAPKITDFPCVRASELAYTAKQYFGYFWSPHWPGCRLQEGVHYRVLRAYEHQGRPAQVQVRVMNERRTTVSYPEYDRLLNHETGTVDLHILFGADKDENGSANPARVTDWNSPNYRDTRRWLVRNGFRGRTWTVQDWQKVCPGHPGHETVEEFEKQTGAVTLRVRLFWGSSGVFSQSHRAHGYLCLVDDAFRNSSLFFYNGHSGQGSNIHPDSLGDLARTYYGLNLSFRPNKDRYQMYVLTGCSTLGYFTIDLFRMKATQNGRPGQGAGGKFDPNGTRNLDIFTNGTLSLFQDLGKMTLAVVDAVHEYYANGRATSYQQILRDMEVDHLTAINGDEDNPNPFEHSKGTN